MTIYLKQSTASQEILLGPFVSSTDGTTAVTGLTIANTDIKIWKAGGTTVGSKNSGGATEISAGFYYAVLDATDTGTLGPLIITVNVATALMLRLECAVLSANAFDDMFGATPSAANITLVDGVALGTHAAGLFPSDLRQIVGAAVNTALAQLGVNTVTNADKTGYTASTVSDKTGYALTEAEHTLVSGTDIPAALTAQGYTSARAGYLDVLNGIVAAIWGSATRTLSAFAFTVTAATVSDKTGYALTAGEHTLISGTDVPAALTAQGYTAARAGYMDVLNGIVAAVWASATRTLSAFAFSVTVGTNNDKTGYALTVAPPTLVQIEASTVLAKEATLTTIDGNVDSILEDTGTTIPATITAIDTLIDRVLGLLHENFRITSPVFNADGNMTSCTMNLYPTATDCTNDTNAIATYAVVATYDASRNLATYKVTKNA